jgi:nitric oxide reductase NorD protein
MQELKSFKQRYDDNTRGRIQALKPGYYTRMGAAIRQATVLLGACKQRRKLLLLVTDGKPNDLDLYEGRYGVEDTREAVLEARRQPELRSSCAAACHRTPPPGSPGPAPRSCL